MSEAKKTEEKTVEELSESKATVKTMSREEFMTAEHLVQTGESETLPDGRNVTAVREGLVEMQEKQSAELTERHKKWVDKANENSPQKTGGEFLKEEVEVSGFANGAISARPVSEKTDEATPVPSPNDPLSDLPENFPGRKHLIAGKVYSLEAVSKLDLDGLKAIDGIGEATAQAILDYKPE